MKMKTVFLIATSIVALFSLQGQEEFTPSGNAYGNIFSNFNYNLNSEVPAFEVTRAYFGYKYNLSENWSADVKLDIGSPYIDPIDSTEVKKETSLAKTAYLKTAAFTYKNGNLKISAGLIGLLQHKVQEKHWGHRYIYKSFQDQNKLSHSADLGVLVQYDVVDILTIDAVIRNGEGYKKIQGDDNFRFGGGFLFTPIDGVSLRGFYDYETTDDSPVTVTHFVGYKSDAFVGGVEHAVRLNQNGEGENLGGLSAYASYNFTKQFQAFGRVDLVSSSSGNDGDGTGLIAGLQYAPIKKVQFALNYQGFMPSDDTEDSDGAVYLNCNLKF